MNGRLDTRSFEKQAGDNLKQNNIHTTASAISKELGQSFQKEEDVDTVREKQAESEKELLETCFEANLLMENT